MQVIRKTEQILIPENGGDLGGGFGVVDISAKETWVIAAKRRQVRPRKVTV
ncbi:MAG: hypothetical protein WDO16_01275 [Bacteroidota bacterium]